MTVFLDWLLAVITVVRDFMWGNWMVILLFLTGIILTVATRGIQIRRLPEAIALIFRKKSSSRPGRRRHQPVCRPDDRPRRHRGERQHRRRGHRHRHGRSRRTVLDVGLGLLRDGHQVRRGLPGSALSATSPQTAPCSAAPCTTLATPSLAPGRSFPGRFLRCRRSRHRALGHGQHGPVQLHGPGVQRPVWRALRCVCHRPHHPGRPGHHRRHQAHWRGEREARPHHDSPVLCRSHGHPGCELHRHPCRVQAHRPVRLRRQGRRRRAHRHQRSAGHQPRSKSWRALQRVRTGLSSHRSGRIQER